MSTKDFWEDDPELLWAYRKSYMDNMKIQRDLTNYKSWLSGLYVYNAISVAIYNSFGRKNGQKIENYVKEPFDFNKTKEDYIRENIEKRENDIKKQIMRGREALKNK